MNFCFGFYVGCLDFKFPLIVRNEQNWFSGCELPTLWLKVGYVTDRVEIISREKETMIDVNIKTVLLGSAKVGKTSLVRRFVENKFVDSLEFTSVIISNSFEYSSFKSNIDVISCS